MVENVLRLTLTLSHRFPNINFARTCLSQWVHLKVTVRCHSFLLCLHTQRNINKSYAVRGNPLLFLPPLVTVSHFFTHPRIRSWHDPWPIRPLRVCLDGTHQRLPPYPCLKFFIVLYQQRFPQLFLGFSHTYTYRWTQFKCVAIAGGVVGSIATYSNDFHRCCPAALLSATTTSTGSVCKRRAWWIQPAPGSSYATTNVGSRNCCDIFVRGNHLSAEALCTCFRHSRLRLHVLMCFVSVIMLRSLMTHLCTWGTKTYA